MIRLITHYGQVKDIFVARIHQSLRYRTPIEFYQKNPRMS